MDTPDFVLKWPKQGVGISKEILRARVMILIIRLLHTFQVLVFVGIIESCPFVIKLSKLYNQEI